MSGKLHPRQSRYRQTGKTKSRPGNGKWSNGHDNQQYLVQLTKKVARQADRANAMSYGRNRSGLGRPAGPRTQPDTPHWIRPRDLDIPDWMTFDRNVASLSLRPGDSMVRGSWMGVTFYSLLRLAGSGPALQILLLAAFAPSAFADGRDNDSWQRPGFGTDDDAARWPPNADVGAVDTDLAPRQPDAGMYPVGGVPFPNDRARRFAPHHQHHPPRGHHHHRGDAAERERQFGFSRTDPRTLFRQAVDAFPYRMDFAGEILAENDVDPDESHEQVCNFITGSVLFDKYVSDNGIPSPLGSHSRKSNKVAVVENTNIINAMWDCNGIPDYVRKVDGDDVNDRFAGRVTEKISFASQSMSDEILKAFREQGFNAKDGVIEYSINIKRRSLLGDPLIMPVLWLEASKCVLLEIPISGDRSMWAAIVPDRKAPVHFFGTSKHNALSWLGNKHNIIWLFERDLWRNFVSRSFGRAHLRLVHKGERNLHDAVGDASHKIVQTAQHHRRHEKFQMTELEKKTDMVERLIPGVSEILDWEDGDYEHLLMDLAIDLAAAGGPEAFKGVAALAEEGLAREAEALGANAMARNAEEAEARETIAEARAIDQETTRIERMFCPTTNGWKGGRGRRSACSVLSWHRSTISKTAEGRVSNLIDKIESDPNLVTFIKTPRGRCEAALGRTMELARRAGYEPRAVGSFLVAGTNAESTGNHFATLINVEGIEHVIDPTAGQFREYGFTGPFVGTKEEWLRTIVSSEKKPVLIYGVYDNASDATRQFSHTNALAADPLDPPVGAEVAGEPEWYRNAKKRPEEVGVLKQKQEAAKKVLEAKQRSALGSGTLNALREHPENVPLELLQKPEIVEKLLENNPKFLRYFAEKDKAFLAKLVRDHSHAVRKIVNGNLALLQEFPELAERFGGGAWNRVRDTLSRGRKYVVRRPGAD
ncbi:MAG: hypothetical protein ACTHNZ_17385 [Trinickia sp.]|uniref:hypothetical protein n=1 Tax=Trinickia sp. TaxID=2571163 RepID=UPI003F7F005B